MVGSPKKRPDQQVEPELPYLFKQEFLSTQDHISSFSDLPVYLQPTAENLRLSRANGDFGFDSLNDRSLQNSSILQRNDQGAGSNYTDSMSSQMQANKIFTFQKQVSSDHESSLRRVSDKNRAGDAGAKTEPAEKAPANGPEGEEAPRGDAAEGAGVSNPGFEYRAISYNDAIMAVGEPYKQ